MPDWNQWLADVFGADVALWILGGLIVAGFLLRLRRKVKPYLSDIREFLEDWRGDPGRPEVNIPERPGVMKRLAQQDTEIANIRAQVTPNHGSTKMLSEEVQQVQADLRALAERFEQHLRK